MYKVNLLLNENTIVDFKLLGKLGLRYKSHFLFAVVFLCSIFLINYYSQPVIYSVNVPVKVVSSHVVANDLSSLLPVDTTNNVTLSELKISISTLAFVRSLSELATEDSEFDSLNFSSVTVNKNLYGRDLKKVCKENKECVVDRLSDNLRSLFSIDQGPSESRFILTVNAKDKKTAKELSSLVIKAIDLNRVQVRQYLVLKEIQSVGNLITEGRSILQKMEGYKALEESEKLKNSIADIKERIRMLQYSSSIETANASSLESRLAENKRSTASVVPEAQENFEKIQKIHSRLVEIKQNISLLSSIPENKRSASDNTFIDQLRNEQARLNSELPSEHSRKKMELSQSFIENQRGKSGEFEFDYQVAKQKLERLDKEYEASKVELSELLQQQLANENKVISMKADLEFLKSLESKQLSLKLLKATMTSDLFFEDLSAEAREFRQSTHGRIFFFSFSLTLFLYILSIIIRFILDDRIYGEDEIRSYLKDLDFIGEVPSFE
jgi:hypothetical protein